MSDSTNNQDSSEQPESFEKRKRDHIELSLDDRTQAKGLAGFDRVHFVHEALPEIDFEAVSLKATSLGRTLDSPIYLNSMTAGHARSINYNELFAEACSIKGWRMGVGSQRRELYDDSASQEWKQLRHRFPNIQLMGNIGITQLIKVGSDKTLRLLDALQSDIMIVHLNALQEVIQPEGTPQFVGGLNAIGDLCKRSVKVVVKETGCGISKATLQRLMNLGLSAVDVSGLGGTHWGRLEGYRSEQESLNRKVSETFKFWGISTVQSLYEGALLKPDYELWASGGVRSGLDVAKSICLGARAVGCAQPILAAAEREGLKGVLQQMNQMEMELKVAMFCTGSKVLSDLQKESKWQWQTTT